MNITVHIPDAIAIRITAEGADLERRALEALVLEEFRAGRMTMPELRAALSLGKLDEFDSFLKVHDLFEPYTAVDLDCERQAFDRTGASLIAALQASPYRDIEIMPERERLPVRGMDL